MCTYITFFCIQLDVSLKQYDDVDDNIHVDIIKLQLL